MAYPATAVRGATLSRVAGTDVVMERRMIKHATSSVFVFCRVDAEWKLGLIEHPRLGRHMLVGGHVEADETQAEAALRETAEESGVQARLLELSTLPLPAAYPHARVPAPWWVTEVAVSADNHISDSHVHVDHQYVAVADSPYSVTEPAHPFAWFSEHELGGLSMFEDTRLLAAQLFPRLDELAPGIGVGPEPAVAAGAFRAG